MKKNVKNKKPTKPTKPPVKKVATKKPIAKKAAKIRATSKSHGPNIIDTLRDLLAKACELALDAADLIADETVVEADEDAGFRAEIEAIKTTGSISLRKRDPKTKLNDDDDYVWIADEADDAAPTSCVPDFDRETVPVARDAEDDVLQS